MISIKVVPPSTATEQTLLVEITEPLCQKVCVNNIATIGGSVSFSAGTVKTINGIAVVPITASGNLFMMEGRCPCNAKNVPFVESFDVPFTATDANNIVLTQGASNVTELANVSCCKASKATLKTTLQLTIS